MAIRTWDTAKNPVFVSPFGHSFQLGKKWKELHVGTCFSQQKISKCGKMSS